MTPVPSWLRGIAESAPTDRHGTNPVLNRFAKAVRGARPAAVLVLFGGPADADPAVPGGLPPTADVLLTQRAGTLRQHSGQVAFPGGAADATDPDAPATALREATEETGLDPSGVQLLRTLPSVYVPPSRFDVTPVIGYWRTPSPVRVIDPAEAQRVVRTPLDTLLDPANRFRVRHPLGYQGPAFLVDGMVVWGFTGGILAGLLEMSGWEREWDRDDVRDLQTTLAQAGMAATLPGVPVADSPILGSGGKEDRG